MSYTKQIWENLPSTNTPITADRLNHMEDGIYDANAGNVTVNNNYSTSTTQTYSCNKVNEIRGEIGKLLWEGTFSSGSLQVNGISNYTMIAVLINNEVLGFGSQRYGGCSFTQYATAGIASYGYRYNYNATTETLSTDSQQTGATNGTNIVPITKIYGIF